MTDKNERYGIFMIPDPVTCGAVTEIALALERQYGFVAAAAFPPHITLIGNLRIDLDETELVRICESVLAGAAVFPMFNRGVEGAGGRSVRYDVDRDSNGLARNEALHRMAGAVKEAVAPIHRDHRDRFAPNVGDYRFAGHLSLASFDLEEKPVMFEEVLEFTSGLPVVAPASFVARRYSLLRFEADWNGPWWRDMNSWQVASWQVGA